LTEQLRKFSDGHDHIWLVLIRHWERDPNWHVKTLLDDRYSLDQQQQFAGVEIYAYRQQ
jgi:hypothetical protein